MNWTRDAVLKALREVFDTLNQLEAFLFTQMYVKLYDITGSDGLIVVMPKVLQYFHNLNAHKAFVERVASEMPTPALKDLVAFANANPEAFSRLCGGSDEDGIGIGGRPGTAVGVHPATAKIQTLVTAVGKCQSSFGYMNACKRLHDILHGLHREYGVLDMAVQKRMRDPSLPLSRSACSLLKNLISDAKETCQDLASVSQKPAWIETLQVCLQWLEGTNATDWEGALFELGRLPSNEMRPLNDRLVDNASRIDFDKLSQQADALLSSLNDSGGPEWSDLIALVALFSCRCLRMTYLIKTHNLCQLVDERLSPIRGPVTVASRFFDWRSIMPRLNEMKLLSEEQDGKDDKLSETINRVLDTYDAASAYQRATTEEDANREFDTFRATFADLFDSVDKEVLKNSTDIISTTSRLVDTLEERL